MSEHTLLFTLLRLAPALSTHTSESGSDERAGTRTNVVVLMRARKK